MDESYQNQCRCRGCLTSASQKDDRFVDLLDSFSLKAELTYLDALNHCTKLSITEDEAYACRYLCDVCKYELISSYQFLIKALESEQKLKEENEQFWKENDVHNSTINFEIIPDSNLKAEIHFICSTEKDKNSDEVQLISENDADLLANKDDQMSAYNFFQFSCEFCTAKFELERNLMEHYSEHDSSNFTICCEECDQRVVGMKALLFHKKQIHDKIEYIDCQICGCWITKSLCKQHLMLHTNKAEFRCNECRRSFSSKFTLQEHMLNSHLKQRKKCFVCKDCGHSFFTHSNLQSHETVHQKERNVFECTLCDRTFMRRSNLKLHMQMHRGETIDCIQCGKQFVRSRDLEIHMRFHTGQYPFQCDICDRRFAIKSHLKYHKRRHNGVRYECQKCKKHFLNLSGLRDHSYEHSRMPFICNICQRGFPTKYKIRRHIANVHCDKFSTNAQTKDLIDQYIKYQETTSIAEESRIVNGLNENFSNQLN